MNKAAVAWHGVRDGTWATTSRLWIWGTSITAVWIIAAFVQGILNARSQPNDFLAFWAAGDMVINGDGAKVYDFGVHHDHTQLFTGTRSFGFLPYLSPPTFLLLAVPLAMLGYFGGFVVWVTVGAISYAWVAWRIRPSRLAVMLAFAAPPTAFNLQIGQTGFMIAAASGVALLDYDDHPVRAGFALAVLSMKPQFGVVIGLALVVQRAWRALAVGVGSSLVLIIASSVLFGIERWQEFFGLNDAIFQILEIRRLELPFLVQGLFSILRGLNVPGGAAWAIHILFAGSVVVLTLTTVKRRGLTPSVMAMVLVAAHVVNPRFYGYDLQFLGLAGLLLIAEAGEDARRTLATAIVVIAAFSATTMLALPGGFIACLLALGLARFQTRRPLLAA